MSHLLNICSELQTVMHVNPPINIDSDKLFDNPKSSQDCFSLNDDTKSVSIRKNHGGGPTYRINCNNPSNQWNASSGVLKNRRFQDEMLFYSLILFANECYSIRNSKLDENTVSIDIDGITHSSRHLP